MKSPSAILKTMAIVYVTLLLIVGVCGCVYAEAPGESVQRPAHHTDNGFANPYLEKSQRGFLKYFKMRYFGGEKYADYAANAHKVPTTKADLELIKNPGEELQITWIGHATMLVQYQGINILTDPQFSDRASPVGFAGPKRFNPPALKIEELPPIDYIVISHNHYDHLDKKSVQTLGSKPLWLVPLRLKKWFVNKGIKEDRVIEFDWWDKNKINGVIVTATPVQHWSARTFWDRKKTLWASWMLEIEDKTVWYSGDTGYNPVQFKEIGKQFPDIDVAMISIGAYEPRWFMKDMHINPEEAVQIFEDLGSPYSLGIQWGTFQLTAEPIDDPPIKLREALQKKDLPFEKFEIMKIGEIRVIRTNK